jgi:hypothetical protein
MVECACVIEQQWPQVKMDGPGIEPRASRMLSGALHPLLMMKSSYGALVFVFNSDRF